MTEIALGVDDDARALLLGAVARRGAEHGGKFVVGMPFDQMTRLDAHDRWLHRPNHPTKIGQRNGRPFVQTLPRNFRFRLHPAQRNRMGDVLSKRWNQQDAKQKRKQHHQRPHARRTRRLAEQDRRGRRIGRLARRRRIWGRRKVRKFFLHRGLFLGRTRRPVFQPARALESYPVSGPS